MPTVLAPGVFPGRFSSIGVTSPIGGGPFVVQTYTSANGQDSNNGNGITTDNLPIADDILLVCISDVQSTTTPIPPRGMQEATVSDNAGPGPFECYFYVIINPAPNTTYTWTIAGTRRSIVGHLIRGADIYQFFDNKNSLETATSTSHATPSLASTGDWRLAVAFAVARTFPTAPFHANVRWTLHKQIVGTDGATNMTVAGYTRTLQTAGTYSDTFTMSAAEPAIVGLFIIRPRGASPAPYSIPNTPFHPGTGPTYFRFIQRQGGYTEQAGGAEQNVFPLGIDSVEAVGAPSVNLGINANGISSSEQLGTSSLTSTYTVAAVGTPSSEAFGSTSVNMTVPTSGISTAEQLGSPSITVITAINAASIQSSELLGTPTLTATATISANGIVSSEQVGSAGTLLAQTVAAHGIAGSEQLGQPAINLTIPANGIVSTEAIGQTSTTLSITPSGIITTERTGSPTVLLAQSIFASGIDSSERLGSATLTPGAVTLAASGIVSAEQLGNANTATISTVQAAGIASTERLGSPTYSIIVAVNATGIASAEAVGAASLSTLTTIPASGIVGSSIVGSPTAAQLIIASGIPSSEILGKPSLTVGAVTVSAGGISSAEVLGNAPVTALPLVAPEPDTIISMVNSNTTIKFGESSTVLSIFDSDTIIRF